MSYTLMVFVACGINHKTASLDLREVIALPQDAHNPLLSSLLALPFVDEALLLSTCNRTEIYCITSEPEKIATWLAEQSSSSSSLLIKHLYTYTDLKAMRHLLRVASGLDSMMLGEPQIFGQMKQAFQTACVLTYAKTALRSIFEYAFNASKRIRNVSGIGNNPVSVASAAVQLISQLFPESEALSIFLIGSGETATLVAKYLHKQNLHHFLVASRTLDNANTLAATLQGKALSITEIPFYLPKVDVVISATTCPLPFINTQLVERALNERQQKPMCFIDLAVPRDIEPEVALLPNVRLYNVDDLHLLAEKGLDMRRDAALAAENLVDDELKKYAKKLKVRKASTAITSYRSHMRNLAQNEVQRALQKLANGACQEQVLHEFSARLIQKLTHNPSTGLRKAASDGRDELLDLAHYLFNISVDRLSHEEIA